MSIFVHELRQGLDSTDYKPGWPCSHKKQLVIMVFNFNFVTISSMSGFERWGEFSDMKKMIAKLEELRKNNEIHAHNCSVMMTGFVRTKTGTTTKIATYKLMYFDNHWVMALPQ